MSDYNFLMESRLTPEQFQFLNQLSRASGEQGLNLYLTGGAVRDLTYGQQVVHDLDFVVEGNPQKLLRFVAAASDRRSRGRLLPEGADHGPALELESMIYDSRLNSAEVKFSNGIRAEITMARSEFYPKPGRRPEIRPGSIFDDLKRRDFSANAMAVSLHPNSRGLLLDPTNGAADIEKREMRVLHGRSFLEDPVRIYRLLRLGLRLGFRPEERTANYLQSALENGVWEETDPKQQGRELRAILYEENPGRALKMLAERELLAGIDRKIASSRIPYERLARIRAIARTIPGADPFLLNFHCLVQKLSGGQKGRLARKIIEARKTVKTALGLEHAAKRLVRALSSSQALRPSFVYKLLSGQPQTLLLFLLVHYPQAKIQKRVKNFLHKYPQVRARLPRAEFQAMGAKPGRKFEQILERLFLDQLDRKIKTHQQLVKEFRRLAGIKEPPPPKPKKAKKAPRQGPRRKPERGRAGRGRRK